VKALESSADNREYFPHFALLGNSLGSNVLDLGMYIVLKDFIMLKLMLCSHFSGTKIVRNGNIYTGHLPYSYYPFTVSLSHTLDPIPEKSMFWYLLLMGMHFSH
jgi:hypothetical protein